MFQRGQNANRVQIIVVADVSDAEKLSLHFRLSVGHDRAKLVAEAFADGGGIGAGRGSDGSQRGRWTNSARTTSVPALRRRRASWPRTFRRSRSARRGPPRDFRLPSGARNRARRPVRRTAKWRACRPSPPWRPLFVPCAGRSNSAETSSSPCAATRVR